MIWLLLCYPIFAVYLFRWYKPLYVAGERWLLLLAAPLLLPAALYLALCGIILETIRAYRADTPRDEG